MFYGLFEYVTKVNSRHLFHIRGRVYAIRKVTSCQGNVPPGAIVEADIAKTKTGPELEDEVELVDVGEEETVFSSRHDVIEVDGGKRKQR